MRDVRSKVSVGSTLEKPVLGGCVAWKVGQKHRFITKIAQVRKCLDEGEAWLLTSMRPLSSVGR